MKDFLFDGNVCHISPFVRYLKSKWTWLSPLCLELARPRSHVAYICHSRVNLRLPILWQLAATVTSSLSETEGQDEELREFRGYAPFYLNLVIFVRILDPLQRTNTQTVTFTNTQTHTHTHTHAHTHTYIHTDTYIYIYTHTHTHKHTHTHTCSQLLSGK